MNYDPVLSVITASFEIMAALWALSGPGRQQIVRATSTILILLAIYQILEVITCAGSSASAFLPQLAFINVTWLPPMGVLLAARLHPTEFRTGRPYVGAMFVAALGFSVWIALHRAFAADPVCQVVFARYSHPAIPYFAYSIFYWVGLAGMVSVSAHAVATDTEPHQRKLSLQLLVGTLAFIIPSVSTARFVGIPNGALASIMCHYALLLAIFLVRLLYLERRWQPEVTPMLSRSK